MEDIGVLFCSLFAMAVFATITGVVAYNKGRNVLGWTLLGLLSWVPLVIVACLPNLKEQQAREAHIAEENRRLREQLRQERIKSEAFRQHAAARLDAHDQHLGIDTRTASTALGGGATAAGELGSGGMYNLAGGGNPDAPWYYGRQGKTMGPVQAAEIADLIRLQVITRDTLLWSENMADWRPAGEVGSFAGHFV